MNSAIEYCRQEVALHDRDRYLVSLFAESKAKAPLWLLYAFNLEIALISERVKEPLLGMMRFTWWRDALSKVYQGQEIPGHAFLNAMAPMVKERQLSQNLFAELLSARERDLDREVFANEIELDRYIDHTSGNLFRLAFAITGENGAQQIAQDLGLAWGLTGLLRATPFLTAQNRPWMPPGVSPEYIAEKARMRLKAVRAARYKGAAKSQLLFADLAALDLQRLKEQGYESAPRREPLDIWRLAVAHWLGIRIS